MEIPQKLIEKLAAAKYVVVLTGAGVSAESGIKTFRDPDGLWTKLNPAELASIDGFMANPDVVWSWYQQRREIISESKPNPGHYAIAKMQDLYQNFSLITQNVDRLHQRAGSKKVIELHGNIIDNHCFDCKKAYPLEIDPTVSELPHCLECGGLIRPSVVWFGELLPQKAIMEAEHAAVSADVFFSAGTSGEVYPAANLPIIARRAGAVTVEVNPNLTAISSYMNFRLNGTSGEAFPALLEKLNEYIKVFENED